MPPPPPPPPPTRPRNHEKVVQETARKWFVETFAVDPERAVRDLPKHRLIKRASPANVATFLLDSKLKLSERQFGEYLCMTKDPFAKFVGGAYASKFDFKRQSLTSALRSFFVAGPFLIPKDVICVEYLCKLFAKRYYNTNHHTFDSFEIVFVISFSALMMSISVHGHRGGSGSPRSKIMTLDTFSSRIRAIQSCEYVEDQVIKDIYEDVLRLPVHCIVVNTTNSTEGDSRLRSDRSSLTGGSHCALRKLSPHLRMSSPGMMNMVDEFIRMGIVDSDLVTKVMQCIDRKLFLDAKNLKLAYLDRRLCVGNDADNSTILLRPSLYATTLSALELHSGLDVLHIESGTGYMTALLAAAVGKRGRVSALDASPLWSKRSRSNVAAVHAILAKSIPGGMSDVNSMCANIWSLPRSMRRKYDRIFCGREVSSICLKAVLLSLLKVGGILVCGTTAENNDSNTVMLSRVMKLNEDNDFVKTHLGSGDIDVDTILPLPKLRHASSRNQVFPFKQNNTRKEEDDDDDDSKRLNTRLYESARRSFSSKSQESYRLLDFAVYDVAMKTLMLKKCLEILHVESGTGYMTSLLARAVGTKGHVVALDAKPEYTKQTRTFVSNIHDKMASIDVMCANVYALPRNARRKYDRIFCERAVKLSDLKRLTVFLKIGGMLVCVENEKERRNFCNLLCVVRLDQQNRSVLTRVRLKRFRFHDLNIPDVKNNVVITEDKHLDKDADVKEQRNELHNKLDMLMKLHERSNKVILTTTPVKKIETQEKKNDNKEKEKSKTTSPTIGKSRSFFGFKRSWKHDKKDEKKRFFSLKKAFSFRRSKTQRTADEKKKKPLSPLQKTFSFLHKKEKVPESPKKDNVLFVSHSNPLFGSPRKSSSPLSSKERGSSKNGDSKDSTTTIIKTTNDDDADQDETVVEMSDIDHLPEEKAEVYPVDSFLSQIALAASEVSE